jgi:hypothetical protein
MKSMLLTVVVALTACAHVEKIHHDIVRIRSLNGVSFEGRYRYPDVFWRTTIDLRPDHTFRYEQMTDTLEHTVIDGTWIREGDRLKMDSPAPHGGVIFYLVVRQGARIGLLAEDSLDRLRKDDALRHVRAQTCWREEKPNKAPDPTRSADIPAAEQPRAPIMAAAHL